MQKMRQGYVPDLLLFYKKALYHSHYVYEVKPNGMQLSVNIF